MLLHVSLYCVERSVAYDVFYAAGVLGRGTLVNTYSHEKRCKYGMALIDLLGDLFSEVGKGDKSAVVDSEVAPVFKKVDRTAYAGL